MSPPKKELTWADLTPEEQEKHLTEELGLSIIEPMESDNHLELTEGELRMLDQFPTDYSACIEFDPAHPDDLEVPDDYYRALSEPYDQVLTTARKGEVEALEALERKVQKAGATVVGKPFRSRHLWCVRVRYTCP